MLETRAAKRELLEQSVQLGIEARSAEDCLMVHYRLVILSDVQSGEFGSNTLATDLDSNFGSPGNACGNGRVIACYNTVSSGPRIYCPVCGSPYIGSLEIDVHNPILSRCFIRVPRSGAVLVVLDIPVSIKSFACSSNVQQASSFCLMVRAFKANMLLLE